MKKVFTILAAAVAALSLASCNKEEILAEQPTASEIKLNITVGNLDGTADTKAIKTGWTAGDNINVWFDEANYSNPDLILTYDGSTWTPGTLNKTPNESGSLILLYEGYNDWNKYRHTNAHMYPTTSATISRSVFAQPIAYANDNYGRIPYTFESNTLTATLDSWKSLTKVQVVVTGLDRSKASNYALKVTNLSSGVAYINSGYISTSNETVGGYTLGLPNEDGVAFYFTNKNGWGESSWTFTLLDIATGTETIMQAPERDIQIGASTVTGIKIASSKFYPSKYIDLGMQTSSGKKLMWVNEIKHNVTFEEAQPTDEEQALGYRIPTRDEFRELYWYCFGGGYGITWNSLNRPYGITFRSPIYSSSLMLPSLDGGTNTVEGHYWTSDKQDWGYNATFAFSFNLLDRQTSCSEYNDFQAWGEHDQLSVIYVCEMQ